ncbi:universal stress protein [Mucilaginibacter sp. L3T2-6]|uniref:universal stress protein n=1 Tax=Mucilaginibacter sp. L3T2-6 TaxID=3062491 RepID=UPI00267648B9|nr:universal stress protein [Mucilaginibacter sp. L3T2-6]MDO3645022.1 universal stress protein [Mucilaginibacter sp. L3T2-6]MDV6217473.1 universal stress protein [Mucilaginibacter sp. L3T2-6]
MNTFKRVVIALDDSPFAEPLAQTALKLVQQLQAETAVLSVADTRALLGTEGLSISEAVTLERNAVTENLGMIIKNVFCDYPVSHYVEEGEPAEKVLAFAREWSADMIVVGTHGRRGLARLLLGSVAEKISRHSSIPVTIIPVNHD